MDENENEKEGMHLSDLIEDTLFDQWQNLGNLELGTDEHLIASKALSEQTKVWTEMTRVELEFTDRMAQRESDERMKELQMIDNRKTNTKSLLISGLFRIFETAMTLGSYDRWYHNGMEFEKTGVVTSHTFSNLLKSRKPNKL